MICFPNAKINLGLNVIRKRPDGYHNIETVFYPIGLCDALEIVPSDGEGITFAPSGLDVGGDAGNNLAVKAYHLLNKYHHLPGVDLFLHKHIPFGAGLGGGSSDAAFVLNKLNELFDVGYPEERLEEIASELGADCAFFIRNRPVFASGIGNVFEPVECSLKNYFLALIKPDIFVSTPEAYSMIKPSVPAKSLKEIIRQPVGTWKNEMFNDFEPSVFDKYPLINDIKTGLYEAGAVYASMSGSGSSVFGIFETSPDHLSDLFPACFNWIGRLG
ncbi:MAG: 4-(cytidine 5'-diphospho)-2-C-methyl-D-erythritol kinase [Candidatus Azobacteroides sp.]|nr:4-(cytidine 5'-diphospho)-2-C-methyl-D-erythritol kinase [Candidatus Azobacteroides sp.]